MVANMQHPPASSEDAMAQAMSSRTLQDSPEIKENGYMLDGRRTPDQNGIEAAQQQRTELTSPASSRSHTSSKASSGKYRNVPFSPPSKSEQSGTSFSSLASNERDTPQASHVHPPPSVPTPSAKSSRAGSRLRNEVQFSPADKQVDLFPFIRGRLNDIPYGNQELFGESHLTPDGLRQQMLNVVFGWEEDVKGLIKDECMFIFHSPLMLETYLLTIYIVSRHPPGSQSAVLLAKWLGGSDTDEILSIMSSGPVSISDWMLLALSQMNGQTQANKVGQAFVQKLLELGDIHTAATILLGLGDKNDAIEVYVSQNHYMEAVLMTCLLMPTDWQRQSHLVRRWGEHAVAHSQQQLATRCFMCTGVEPAEPWSSPPAQTAASFAEGLASKSPVPLPEVSYPNPASVTSTTHQRKPSAGTRATAKTPALKLITSFDSESNSKLRLPGLKSDNQTPTNAPWITPIAESAVGESALSPGGLGSYRMNNVQSLNQAMGSRTNTPGFSRGRLPSIGETPIDVHPPTFPSTPFRKEREYATTSDSEDQNQESPEESLSLLPSARYDPEKESHKPSPQTAIQAGLDKFSGIKGLPSPAPGVFDALRDCSESRNGSRDRKPDGLQLHLLQGNPSQSGTSDPYDRINNARSPPSTSNSLQSTKTPSTSGRSIDQFIHSLDEANYYARKNKDNRAHGHVRRNTDQAVNNTQEPRGRNENRHIQPARRSPSSPVPMSPEEVAQHHTNGNKRDESRRPRQGGSRTRNGSRVRRTGSRNSSRRGHNRSSSRNNPSRTGDRNDRDHSTERASSPQPMDDALRLVTSDRERLRSHQRSSSRRGEQRSSGRRDTSPDSSRRPARSRTDSNTDQESASSNTKDVSHDENYILGSKAFEISDASMDETREVPFTVALSEQKRKELAAAELEARRLSLARNPSAPNIPFPGDVRAYSRSPLAGLSYPITPFGQQRPQARQRSSPSKDLSENRSSSESGSSGGAPVAFSATPRAMRHPNPKYNNSPKEQQQPAPSNPDNTFLLSDARYQPEAERIGRSMSVPALESHPRSATIPTDLPMHPRYNPSLPRSRSTSRTRNLGHRRQSSRELGSPGGYYNNSPVAVSIEETLENAENPPPILPELQHLNTPPPPPPPPFSPSCTSPRESSGTIDIAIDNENLGRMLPRAMTAGPASTIVDPRPSPDRRRMSLDHRRGKSANESFTSKIRNLTRRRSNSRGLENWGSPVESEMPYESVQMVDHRF